MKKSFKVFALSLVAVSALFACSKEMDVINDKPVVDGNKTILTIKATNPESVATKTTMSGTTPSWLAGDKITVIYQNKSDAVATAESTPLAGAITTATFDATLVDANTSINGYAVYPANDLAQTLSVAKIPIAAEQHPTGTAFDGTSDIMVSEAFTPAGTVSTRFARLGAILRVKVSNATLNDEKILNLSVTAESNLVGNASVNLSDASLSELTDGSETVTATYEPANQFTVGAAEKYVYLIVYPQELAAGSSLTISGETENYTFSREITLPNKIVLNPGHIIPLNITVTSISRSNVELPWSYPIGEASATSAELTSIGGVSASGLGSDYAAGNAPYQIKFDTTGDYIQVKTDKPISTVSIKYKMIGGGNTSSIDIYESTDGSSWGSSIENLEISGSQNDEGTLTTTKAFSSSSRFIKISFNKGSNVGIGGITITESDDYPHISATDISGVAAVGVSDAAATYSALNFVDDVTVTSVTGCVSEAIADAGDIIYTVTPNKTLSARAGTIVLASTASPSIKKTINVSQLASVFEASSTDPINFAWDDETQSTVESVTITSTYALTEGSNLAVSGTNADKFIVSLTPSGVTNEYTLEAMVMEDNESGANYTATVTVSRDGYSISIDLKQAYKSVLPKGSTKTYSIYTSTSNNQSFNKLIGNDTSSGNYSHASSKSITLDSHTWTITTTGNGSVIYCGGQQLGAGDKNGTKRDVTGVTMITSAYTQGIKTITVSSATNGSGSLSVYVNDVQVETAKSLADDVVYTLDSITAGEIKLIWTQSTAGKNLTIKSITVN